MSSSNIIFEALRNVSGRQFLDLILHLRSYGTNLCLEFEKTGEM